MKRLSLSLLSLSSCSLIGPLFVGGDCEQPDNTVIACRLINEEFVATVCLDGAQTAQPCAVDQFCSLSGELMVNNVVGCGFLRSCGNGQIDIVDPEAGIEEECDDGNGIDTDGCFSCKENVCGDGVVNLSDGDDPDSLSDENCEPKSSGDCNAQCLLGCLEDIDCVEALTPEELECFSSVTCNNQVCEQAIISDNNECTRELCLPNEGLFEQELSNGTPCTGGSCFEGFCRLSTCGDEALNAGEECDDGNTTNGDGCDINCRLESCGNGVLDVGEECDDQNASDTDFCTTDCRDAFCGDSFTQPDRGETCDDGVLNGSTSCSSDCQRCGDQAATGGELCDGSDFRGLSCVGLDFAAGSLQCSSDCQEIGFSGCVPTNCGDGVVNNGEGCDDGNQINNDGCSNACTLPLCGDNIQQSGEECDEGVNNDDTSGCTTGCQSATCGDGLLHIGVEECDDGNNISNDGCSGACTTEIVATCGNGAIDPVGEECDDGNNVNGDACDVGCQLETSCSFGTQTAFDEVQIFQGTQGAGNDLTIVGDGCVTPLSGPDLIFQIYIPEGTSGFVANLNATLDLALAVRIGDCSSNTVLFRCTDGFGGIEGVSSQLNPAILPAVGYFIVDSKTAADNFSLRIDIQP